MAVIVNGDGILTGISSLATSLTDITSGRGTVTGVATVGTLQLGAGVSISSPRSQQAAIFTNNTEFFTVDDAGRVGVGTVTPNSDAHPENEKKINVGFITARSIAGDIDANTMVVAGISTFVGALNAAAISGTTGTFSGNMQMTGSNPEFEMNAGGPRFRVPAANTLSIFTTGGLGSTSNERVRITSDGKVGIGEDSPEYKLTVYDAGYSGVTIKTNRSGATENIGGLHFKTQSTNVAYIQSLVNGSIKFRNSSSLTERMRITSAGRVSINDGTRSADDAASGATLRVTGTPITRNQYYSPAGHYFGAIGFTDDTNTKSWLAVDSHYAQSSAVSAGIFLSAFHQDAGGSGCGYTIKNLKTGNPLVFSSVVTAASTNNPAVETERLRLSAAGELIMSDTSTKTFIDVETTGNNTRALLSVKGKNSSGGDVSLKIGAFGDTERGEIFTHSNHDLGFATNNNAAQFKCKTGGNFEIVNGDLVVASGHGIDFSAAGNAGGMVNELLDDYEEGTWTAAIGTQSGSNYTLSTTYNKYTKIGNVVHIYFSYTFTAEGSGTITYIPLPFAVDSNLEMAGNGYVTSGSNRKSVQFVKYTDTNLLVRIDDGDSFVQYWSSRTEWAPTNRFVCNMTYHTA